MILGLDISTSKIGYCVIDDNKKLLEVNFKKLKEDTLRDDRGTRFTLIGKYEKSNL